MIQIITTDRCMNAPKILVVMINAFQVPVVASFSTSSVSYIQQRNTIHFKQSNVRSVIGVFIQYARRHHPHDNNDDKDNSYIDDDDNDILRHRMYPLQITTLEQIYQRSLPLSSSSSSSSSTTQKKSSLSFNTINDDRNDHNHRQQHYPIPFIEFCLHCLLHNDIPYPDSGIRFLLRVSTPAWKEQIYRSVGYYHSNNSNKIPIPTKPQEEIISAISTTISQYNNQYGILVGDGEKYRICFPSEPFEYEITTNDHNHNNNYHTTEVASSSTKTTTTTTTTTTTIWIECQLRHYDTNELLVIMGWQLLVVPSHDTDTTTTTTNCTTTTGTTREYQIDRIDWQDFREMFRPGIGREEWMRICG